MTTDDKARQKAEGSYIAQAHGDDARAEVTVVLGASEQPQAENALSRVHLPAFNPGIFIGRSASLQVLDSWASQPGMFLLSGEPGSGKSTLALMFAWQARAKFEAVVFQTCGRRSVEVIAGEMAGTLRRHLPADVTSWPPEQRLQAIREWLQQQRSLLVLDDLWLEDFSGSAAGASLSWRDLLPGPPVNVLFTSRRISLPGVTAKHTIHVGAFTQSECEEAFRLHLDGSEVDRNREALLEFAGRLDRLPIAVMVGADLLRRQWKPLGEAQRGLTLEKLRNEVHDVAGLFQKAIETQGPGEQRFLAAAAACVPDGFWLPLAGRIAGLEKEQAEQAAASLMNSSLLQLQDGGRQRFRLHSLLHEQLLRSSVSQREREAHAGALTEIFKEWESGWRDCRECLAEIVPAIEFLRNRNSGDGNDLNYRGYALASRVGELETALRIEQAREQFWSRQPESRESQNALQVSYGNQALILKAWGRLVEAMALHKKKEAICEELTNKDSLQISYGNQALILQAWGRLEEAMALLKKQEAICEELGIKDSLQISYGNQALILKAWGRLEEAMALHKKEEALCEELANKDGLQASYGNQALILQAWRRSEEAMALLKKQEAMCEELANKGSLQISYGNQALILKVWGRLEEAMALLKKQEAICEELANKDSLQRSYGNQALILQMWGRLEEAMALHKKAEAICEELGNKSGLAYCCWNWGLLAREMKDPKTAEEKLMAALAIFTELKMPREQAAVEQALNAVSQQKSRKTKKKK